MAITVMVREFVTFLGVNKFFVNFFKGLLANVVYLVAWKEI